jgi:hypothetical protein
MGYANVASAIEHDAPLLAKLVGGRAGLGVSAAATILSNALGTSNNVDAIQSALKDPAAIEKVRQAETNQAVWLRQLAATAAQAPDSPGDRYTAVASLIEPVAPLLAGLIRGQFRPGVTAAAAIISHALGTPSDPAFVESALNDPGALEKIRQAERANVLQLQQLVVTAAQERLAHESVMALLEASDQANRDWVPKVLAMTVTAGFFGVLLLMAFQPLPSANKDLVNVIVGALGMAWVGIIGYYFGTSVGPMRKAELLAKPTVAVNPFHVAGMTVDMQAYLAAKAGLVEHQLQADLSYSRLSLSEVLRVRGVDRFVMSVLGVLAAIALAIQSVPGLAVTLISSARAQEGGVATSGSASSKPFVPPLGLSLEIWRPMVVVMFALLVMIAIAFLWKGYFAKTKSEKAAGWVDRFGTVLIGALIGKTLS